MLLDGFLVPKTEPMDAVDAGSYEIVERPPQIRVSNFATQSANSTNSVNNQQNDSNDSNSNDITPSKSEHGTSWSKDNSNSNLFSNDINSPTEEMSPNSSMSSPTIVVGQKSMRRRIRRKHNSPDDQAEALTEMSVRGLNLFRYASIEEGVYKCTECAKENVQKTFKNKYSFQRHAFLYHEGTQRKVFPCPVCRKEFSRPDKMKNHMKMTHECYMPKECKFPLPLIIAGSSQAGSMSQSTNNNLLNVELTQQSCQSLKMESAEKMCLELA